MRRSLLLFAFSLVAACGGDYSAAVADVTFTPIDEEPVEGGESLLDDSTLVGGTLDPAEDPVTEDPVEEDPIEDPEPDEPDDPPEDEPEPDIYDPDWTDHEDPAVEVCLGTLPAICNKVNECSAEQPVLELLGGFCPTLFDSISPLLTLGCEQVGDLLGGALPGVDLPIGGALDEMIFTLITGCIENFECDPAYLQELGAAFGDVIALLGQGQGEGGGDIGAALPALLKLAEMCGGLENFLPF